MQHTNILAQLDPGHNLEDSLDSADLLKAQGNVSVNGNPPCVVRSLLPRMTAPGDIGGAGSSNMDIISLYDNEFPLLKVNGLYAALTSGDGDCLFHSLSDQLYGHEQNHMQLRQRVVQHLRNYSSYFKAFIDVLPVRRAPRRRAAASHKSDFEHHSQAEINKAYEERLLRMANKGVFGDNLEIQAFAREFQVNVKIYQRENAYVICPDNTMGPNPNGDTRTVHIAYHMWEHYSSIRNRDGPFSGPPCVRGQRAISDREKRKLLNGVTIILPWMEDIVSASIPHCESPERIREALQQCNGDVDEAAKLLQDEWYSSSNVDTDSTAPDDEEYYQSAEPSVMNEDLARMDDRQLTERIIKGDAGYEEEQVASLEIQSKTLIVAGKESMLIAQAHTQDVSLPIREPSSATVQNADNDGEYSGAKRRKSPDGSPIGVPATPINSSSDETSSAGSSGSSSDNTERRRRKPVKKSAIPALPTRRSTRIQALAKDAEKAAAAPPPPPKAPRARKPRAKTTTTPTTTSAKKKPVRKRGGAVIGIVTVGIRELYV